MSTTKMAMKKNFFSKFVMIFIVLALMLSLPVYSTSSIAYADGGDNPLAQMLVPEGGDIIPDYYIVVYKPMEVATAASAVAADTAQILASGGKVGFVYDVALQGYSAYLPLEALEKVRQNPLVDYVAADARVYLDDGEIGDEAVQNGATWGLDRIDQRNLPLSNTYTYTTTAGKVHVYILDTGINASHVLFGGRATKSYDAIGDGQQGNDCHGHGTHVAGTIGSSTYGVAKGVKLHAVRVLNCYGSGEFSQVIAGVNWVTAHHVHPAVANMSLGTGGSYPPLESAIQASINHGVTYVIAAGNDSLNACNYTPARVPAAITVGSTTSTDARSYFSNFGSCLDIFAPGSSITSTWIGSSTAINTISGTSMASPHVAGVAALYLAAHPAAKPATVRNALVNKATSNKVTDPGSGSSNRLLYSRLSTSTVPVPKTPSGTITDKTPTYKWTKISGATKYQYQLMRGTKTVYTKTVASGVCNTTTCTNTPATTLGYAAYKWRVRALVGGAWKTWSAYKNFTVAAAGFNSQFNGASTGWVKRPGGTWKNSSNAYFTSGVANKSSSSSYNKTFKNFTYQARMKRVSSSYGEVGLVVRGAPTFDSYNDWRNAYYFLYDQTGYFSVLKRVNGSWTTLKGWTSSASIVKDGWNTLKVVANGSSLRYYINGKLVWSGSDAKFASGQVGLWMYRRSKTERMDVDWAKLSPISSSSSLGVEEVVEEGQVEIPFDPSNPFRREVDSVP